LTPVMPIEFSAASLPMSGARALTASPLASWTVNQTGPTSMIAARRTSAAETPRPSATALRWFTKLWLGKCEEQPLAVDLDFDETLAALLHQPASRAWLEAEVRLGPLRLQIPEDLFFAE